MTKIREQTLKMIERLPDDKMVYIFNILQNIEAFSMSEKIQDAEISKNALETLMKYSGTLPEDFDYKAELEAARTKNMVILIDTNI